MKIVSPDDFLVNKDGEYEWTPERATAAWDRAYADLDQILGQGRADTLWLTIGLPGSGKSTWLAARRGTVRDVVLAFDATLCSRISRQPLIEIASSHNVKVEGFVFDVPLITVIRRNAQRPENRRVPYTTLATMSKELHADSPTLLEGFQVLTRVQT